MASPDGRFKQNSKPGKRGKQLADTLGLVYIGKKKTQSKHSQTYYTQEGASLFRDNQRLE